MKRGKRLSPVRIAMNDNAAVCRLLVDEIGETLDRVVADRARLEGFLSSFVSMLIMRFHVPFTHNQIRLIHEYIFNEPSELLERFKKKRPCLEAPQWHNMNERIIRAGDVYYKCIPLSFVPEGD